MNSEYLITMDYLKSGIQLIKSTNSNNSNITFKNIHWASIKPPIHPLEDEFKMLNKENQKIYHHLPPFPLLKCNRKSRRQNSLSNNIHEKNVSDYYNC